MATFYATAGPDIAALIAEVIEEYHPDLHSAGLVVDALWASSTAEDTPAIKHHGYPALAVIKINNVRDRLRGLADATITIDRAAWLGMTDARRRALIDHECQHCELVPDGESDSGAPKLDDAGRPKLKIRSHDYELGIFDAVIRRHGEHAPDHTALKAAASRLTQLAMPWG